MDRQRFRFNLVFLALVTAAAALPWLVGLNAPVAEVVVSLLALGALAWTVALFNSVTAVWSIRRRQMQPKLSPPSKDIQHLVVVTSYDEPLELLQSTIDSLAAQPQAKQITVAVAMEERAPRVMERIAALQERFTHVFSGLHFTVHPPGLPNEIPGKCSNVNYALRTLVKQLGLNTQAKRRQTIITTCDADNLFHSRHFEILTEAVAKTNDRTGTIWQAGLFYDWNEAKSRPFTRTTGTLRSIFMMGLLAPFDISTMSIQSFSLELCIRGDYFHPGYHMEDIMNVPRWSTYLGKNVRVQRVSVAVLSGPTSGDTFGEELRQWALQAKRWANGAAEVFHYFLSRGAHMPPGFVASFALRYMGYYALFLSAIPLLGVFTGLGQLVAPEVWQSASLFGVSGVVPVTLTVLGLWNLGALLLAFVLKSMWRPLLPVREPASIVRTLLDIMTAIFTFIAYAFIVWYALWEMAFVGKASCRHEHSSKAALAG